MKIVPLTPDNILDYGFCGYKNSSKHKEMSRKADWYGQYYPKGLRICVLLSENDGSQGMIEYIPGEYAHRPVLADNFMVIHCLFVGYRKEYKGRGYGTLLIEHCINDAETQQKQGVAVVTRKGSFMAKKDVFLKEGFSVVDRRKPDFELSALLLNDAAVAPKFADITPDEYSKGLYILRSPQCPYTEKNVMSMVNTARDMKLDPIVVDLNDHESARRNPSPFGTFAIIYNGKILSHHPISNTRFQNIMNAL
jgi:hypothetical protein